MDSIVHFEIPAVDLARAKKFYEKAFGWKIEYMKQYDYSMVLTTPTKDHKPSQYGAINGGMMKRNKIVKASVVTLQVKNIDTTLKSIAKLGGKSLMGKTPVGDMGYTAYIKDTEGYVIGLFQKK